MKNPFSSFFKKDDPSSKITPIILVIILIIIGFISFAPSMKKTISKEKATTIAQDFINAYLMEPGSKASVINIEEEYGLYKMEIDILTTTVESYLSKDGKLFFPQALNVEEISSDETAGGNTQTAPLAEVTNKTDKPVVELFVMSHCPYGTQMEKGILPVVKTLGDTIDFQLKFNSYAMHGEVEIVEQMNQHCIMEEQPEVFVDYLECFLVAGDSESCLTSAKVNTNKLTSCYNNLEKENNIVADFENRVGYQGNYPGFNLHEEDNTKYGVGGSPTLVINGQTISASRDSASLLYTICSAFNTQPDSCFETLSNLAPAPGFGTGTTSSNATVECQ